MARPSWEPTNRASWWRMCDDWCKNIELSDNKIRWRVPEDMFARLRLLRDEIIHIETTPTNYRTKNIVKKLSDLYEELGRLMRNIKRMCFMSPPLTSADYIMLGLKEPDRSPTDVRVPRAVPTVESFNAGGLRLKFVVRPESGSQYDKKSCYGIKLKGCIVPRGKVSGKYSVAQASLPSRSGIIYKTDGDPEGIGDLHWTMFTRKKRFDLIFDTEDRAGLFYYGACYENAKGECGPWSSLSEAVIA